MWIPEYNTIYVCIYNMFQRNHIWGFAPFNLTCIENASANYFNIIGILTGYYAINYSTTINKNRFIAIQSYYSCFMYPRSEIVNFGVFFINATISINRICKNV